MLYTVVHEQPEQCAHDLSAPSASQARAHLHIDAMQSDTPPCTDAPLAVGESGTESPPQAEQPCPQGIDAATAAVADETPRDIVTSPALAAVARHVRAAIPKDGKHPASPLLPQPSLYFSGQLNKTPLKQPAAVPKQPKSQTKAPRARKSKAKQQHQPPPPPAPEMLPSPVQLCKPHPLLGSLDMHALGEVQAADGPGGMWGDEADAAALSQLLGDGGSLDDWVATDMPALASRMAHSMVDVAASTPQFLPMQARPPAQAIRLHSTVPPQGPRKCVRGWVF